MGRLAREYQPNDWDKIREQDEAAARWDAMFSTLIPDSDLDHFQKYALAGRL